MGMTIDGLSYWQAESGGIDLLDSTLGDDQRPSRVYPGLFDGRSSQWATAIQTLAHQGEALLVNMHCVYREMRLEQDDDESSGQ